MPKTRRTRVVAVPPPAAWAFAADPGKLPRWWPAVERVDRRDPSVFTKWVVSPRGRAVPMTFSLAALEEGRSIEWTQELEGTTFAKALRSASERIEVVDADGASAISVTIDRKMRGTARLGALFVARGQRRELDSALDRLEERLGG